MCLRDQTIHDVHEIAEGKRTGNVSLKFLVLEMNKQFLKKKMTKKKTCHFLIGIPSIVWSSYPVFSGWVYFIQ